MSIEFSGTCSLLGECGIVFDGNYQFQKDFECLDDTSANEQACDDFSIGVNDFENSLIITDSVIIDYTEGCDASGDTLEFYTGDTHDRCIPIRQGSVLQICYWSMIIPSQMFFFLYSVVTVSIDAVFASRIVTCEGTLKIKWGNIASKRWI